MILQYGPTLKYYAPDGSKLSDVAENAALPYIRYGAGVIAAGLGVNIPALIRVGSEAVRKARGKREYQ